MKIQLKKRKFLWKFERNISFYFDSAILLSVIREQLRRKKNLRVKNKIRMKRCGVRERKRNRERANENLIIG